MNLLSNETCTAQIRPSLSLHCLRIFTQNARAICATGDPVFDTVHIRSCLITERMCRPEIADQRSRMGLACNHPKHRCCHRCSHCHRRTLYWKRSMPLTQRANQQNSPGWRLLILIPGIHQNTGYLQTCWDRRDVPGGWLTESHRHFQNFRANLFSSLPHASTETS